METTSADNHRSSDRVSPSKSTVALHGLRPEPVPAIVIDESFGGIGVAAPFRIEPGREIDIELSVEMGGIRSTALVRYATKLPSGCRLGLEWKAQALSRGLRDLLTTDTSSKENLQLVRILPGGLSVMWKLFESQRWEQLLASADRLRKEAAACRAQSLSEPIDRFQHGIREAMEAEEGVDANSAIENELNTLISKCIETIKQ
jgi:hypothetical protein